VPEVPEVPVCAPVAAVGAALPPADDAHWLADELAEEVTGAAVWLTVEVAAAAACVTVEAAALTVEAAALTVDVTGAAALLTLDAACETPAEAAGAAAEEAGAEASGDAELPLAGVVTADTTPPTALTTSFTVVPTAPSKPPDEPAAGDDEAGAARPVVAACALEPDISQNTVISPRQQPASTRTREANRPTPLRPADSHVSGTAYSTPVQPP
jgi:hypothetical protein